MRKFMVKAMNDGTPMVEALESGMKDTTTKERYFLTPAALGASVYTGEHRKTSRSPRRDNQSYRRDEGWNESWGGSSWKKGGKGGGKGKKGGNKGKAKDGGRKYHNTSPDGRAICFSWNNKNQRCRYDCGRLHICQLCCTRPMHAPKVQERHQLPRTQLGRPPSEGAEVW